LGRLSDDSTQALDYNMIKIENMQFEYQYVAIIYTFASFHLGCNIEITSD